MCPFFRVQGVLVEAYPSISLSLIGSGIEESYCLGPLGYMDKFELKISDG